MGHYAKHYSLIYSVWFIFIIYTQQKHKTLEAIVSTETQEKLKKFTATTFTLVKSKNSGFLKDETGVNGVAPVYLNTSKSHMLLMASRLFLGTGNGYMHTQYIVGAPTHYLNDYYEDGEGNLVLESLFLTAQQATEKGYQFRPGLKTLYNNDQKALNLELGNSNRLGVCFENGILELGKYSSDPVLLRFVNEHEQNDDAPRAAENKDVKRSRLFQFKKLVKEQVAGKSRNVENFDADFQAMEFVATLRKKVRDGYEYDKDMLTAVLTILEDGKGLGAEDVQQKFALIVKAAKADGAAFMGMINTAMDEIKMGISVAEKLKVLSFSAKEVKMMESGKDRVIYTFKKGAEKVGAINELVLHFLSGPQGDSDYVELIRLTDVAKVAALK